MLKTDLHNHTIISHGTADAETMHDAGKQAGLDYMGISEHSPLPDGFFCRLYTGDLAGEFPRLVEKVLELKKKPDSPKMLLGLELDWLPGRMDWMRGLVNEYPFDYVLGSLHFLDGWSVGNDLNWRNLDRAGRFGRFSGYYYEMASMAASGLAQIASHPDFIKMRAFADYHAWLGTPQGRDALRAALESMARHNVAMEVNSAGLRQEFHEPYPCAQIMRIARELDLQIVFGSDAHSPEDSGSCLDVLKEYAGSFGFDHSLIFINKKPEIIPFSA